MAGAWSENKTSLFPLTVGEGIFYTHFRKEIHMGEQIRPSSEEEAFAQMQSMTERNEKEVEE